MDKESQTYDNSRGGHTVKWVDGLNQEHTVYLSDKLEVSVTFRCLWWYLELATRRYKDAEYWI